ncbi:MAG: methyl-accepting chemotaxis protein [Desulfobacteraceae bacterium]|nr:methyl-accepting chemotaxis protein [Desulfobacteraceae bacterium]
MRTAVIKRSSKLIAWGVIVALLPMLTIGIMFMMKASAALTDIETEQIRNLKTTLISYVEEVVSREMMMLKNFARYPVMQKGIKLLKVDEGEIFHFHFNKDLTHFHDKKRFQTFFVANEKGIVATDASQGIYRGLDISKEEYFTQAMDGKTFVDKVIQSQETKEPVAVIASPLADKDGKIAGIMVSHFRLTNLNKKISDIRIGKTGHAFITDNKTKMVISHPKSGMIMKDLRKIKGMEFICDKILSSASGIEKCSFKGSDYVVAFGPVKSTHWTLGITIPESEYMAPLISMRNTGVLVGTVLIVFSVSAVLIFSGRFTRDINQVNEILNEGAEQVADSSRQVASASQELAETSSEQAASLGGISSSLEDMSSITRQNAVNACKADKLAKETDQIVNLANDSMTDLTGSMEDISKASEENQKIIKTIDEIAFQTNLLALNAAVESARAGEAGAGFAVVADEVRNLAMRSADAARNTSDLIEDTVKKIGYGRNLVTKANDAFSQVALSASEIGRLVGEIATASTEQDYRIDYINKAVAELEKITNKNAANAEESASAAEQMNAQTGQIQRISDNLVVLVGGKVK